MTLDAVCGFCGKDVDSDVAVEVTLRSAHSPDEPQGFYAHAECVVNAVHDDMPLHPDIEPDP